MKKLTMAIVAIALVLCMAQAVMAKGEVGLKLGYDFKTRYYDESGEAYDKTNSFLIGLSGNYYVYDGFSLAAKASLALGKYEFFGQGEGLADSTQVNVHLFARYNVLELDAFSLGVQVGGIYEYYSKAYLSVDVEWSHNLFFIAPGLYLNYDISQKINVYGDFKFPVYYNISGDFSNAGFFKVLFYDITVGGAYKITPNIYLGLEAVVSNSTAYKLEALEWESIYKVEFSIGIKAGYKF